MAERLEHPDQDNLFQRIGSYGYIEKLPTIEAVKQYIETRLKLAGTNIKIFADDCMPAIWEFSEHGVPRLVNKICKLCLKAGETNQFDYITEDIVTQIAAKFRRRSQASVQPARYNRTEHENDLSGSITDTQSENDTSFKICTPLNSEREETGILIQFPIAVSTDVRLK